MTIAEVEQVIASKTTDASGHIANFTFRKSGTIAHLEARLDKSGGKSPALWRIVWNLHWRSDRGQEQRDSSPDLKALLKQFGPVDLNATSARALDEL
jgi:hypothetical protein